MVADVRRSPSARRAASRSRPTGSMRLPSGTARRRARRRRRPQRPRPNRGGPPRAPGAFGWIGAAVAVLVLIALPWSADALPARPAQRRARPAGAVVVQPPRTIAVLPLADMSPGGGNSYLGDGLAQELSARLARIHGLRVASRTSVVSLQGPRRGRAHHRPAPGGAAHPRRQRAARGRPVARHRDADRCRHRLQRLVPDLQPHLAGPAGDRGRRRPLDHRHAQGRADERLARAPRSRPRRTWPPSTCTCRDLRSCTAGRRHAAGGRARTSVRRSARTRGSRSPMRGCASATSWLRKHAAMPRWSSQAESACSAGAAARCLAREVTAALGPPVPGQRPQRAGRDALSEAIRSDPDERRQLHRALAKPSTASSTRPRRSAPSARRSRSSPLTGRPTPTRELPLPPRRATPPQCRSTGG